MLFECDCRYCKDNTYLGDASGVLYVEIPKNASFIIKEKLIKPKKCDISFEEAENYSESFLVFRDPIERFKSLCSHYLLDGSRLKYGQSWMNILGLDVNNYNGIADMVLSNFQELSKISEPHHWSSQSSFIPDFVFDKDVKIYGMSQISEELGVPQQNISSSNKIELSENDIERIKLLYEDDFKIYDKYLSNL